MALEQLQLCRSPVCCRGHQYTKTDSSFVVDIGPPKILKARRDCVLHTIKLYQEIAASSLYVLIKL